MGFNRLILLAGAAAALATGGCSWMHPETQYALEKEWDSFTDYDWKGNAEAFTGWNEVFPSATQLERKQLAETCLHGNSENRLIFQDGIEDSAGYRRCVLEAYPEGKNAPGQRMGNRPEPQG